MTGRRLALALLLLAEGAARGAERLPEWAAAVSVPYVPESPEVPAVVLYHEREIVFEKSGRTETRDRAVVRCLTGGCGAHAVVAVPYLRGTRTVTGLRLHLLQPDGSSLSLGPKETVDAAADLEALYDEERVALLSARRDVKPGSVLASEWTLRDTVPFSQLVVSLQDRLPVVAARVTVVLPLGWTVSAVSLNGAPAEAKTRGARTTWEVAGLPYRPEEPLAPSAWNAVPLLVLTVKAAPGEGGAFPAFGAWEEVSRWAASSFDSAAAPDEAVTARMKELALAAASPREKLEAAARFVQGINYVSVSLDLGRGGGYRPRPAGAVLRQAYGDCKDKVTLLRGLLAAAGIASRPVLVCARDATAVRRESPMPFAFDHVVVGVAGVGAKEAEPVVEAEGERLLLFDPTDPFTPLGQLPEALWNGPGLVVAREGEGLVTIPPGKAHLERRIAGEMKGDGTFTARLVESGAGASGESLRALARRASSEELQRAVEEWLAAKLPGVKVSGVRVEEAGTGPALVAALSGRLPGVQTAGSLMVVRPVLIPWRGFPSLPSGPRRLPVVLRPRRFSAEYRLKLPPSFDVAELPAPVKVERPFGSFVMTTEASEGTLVVRQELSLPGGTVAPADYAAARELVNAVLASREAAVVLKRSW